MVISKLTQKSRFFIPHFHHVLFITRQERANLAAQPLTTRTTTGKLPAIRSIHQASSSTSESPSSSSNASGSRTVVTSKATPEEIKEKMEQQLRLQRAAHHQKRALEMQKGN